MPKLPQVSGQDLIKAFSRLGFRTVSQKGSHVKMQNHHGKTVIIPNHRVIKKGTLKKGILNPLGISVEDLVKALQK